MIRDEIGLKLYKTNRNCKKWSFFNFYSECSIITNKIKNTAEFSFLKVQFYLIKTNETISK